MKLKLTLVTLTAAVLGASSAALLAEDLSQVKVTYDKAAAERTNMPSREGTDPGNLKVTFDPAVAERTNMQRPAGAAEARHYLAGSGGGRRGPTCWGRNRSRRPQQAATTTK